MKLVNESAKFNRFKEKLFYLGILTIITIVLWIGLGIYFSFTKTDIDPEMTKLIKPINPMLNAQVIIDYESSRVPAPEQFQITAMIKDEGQTTSSIVIIDPFNPQAITSASPTNASDSAILTQ